MVSLPLSVSGQASAEDGVAQVSVSILDTRTSKWWGDNGWNNSWAGHKTSISATSATDANWQITLNLQDDATGSGSYLIIAGLDDSAGVYHSNDSWQRYFSAQDQTVEVVEAGIQYIKPAADQSVSFPASFTGSVSSPTGIAQVSLAIMDMENYKWWDDVNKVWSVAWTGTTAELAFVDSSRSNWSYSFDPRGVAGSGKYRIFTGFSDAAWVYSATTWKRDFLGFEQVSSEEGIKFTNIAPNQEVSLPAAIKGTAVSANGVAEVSLSIMDTTTFKWWTVDGWSDTWSGLKAGITSRSGNMVNWQYSFNAGSAEGSGNYRVLTGMSDLNWKYLTDSSWTIDFKKATNELVTQVSPGIYQLRDLVEYDWLVGCVPTAVSMMIGYWDRNGYGGLITGDSTRHSTAIDDLIFSPGHLADYLQPTEVVESFDDDHGIIPDKSDGIPSHADNSLADYVSASQSRMGLDYGWSRLFNAGTGIHGWATAKGYGGFRSTSHEFNDYSFEDYRAEILEGRPVLVSVDVRGFGTTDHMVLGVAFNDDTKELGVLNGWDPSDSENPPTINWLTFGGLEVERNWGMGSFITVMPPKADSLQGPNAVLVESAPDSDKAYYSDGKIDGSGTLTKLMQPTLSNLGGKTIALASADGHRFMQFYDDGAGSAALYQSESQGDGKFSWVFLSADAGPNRFSTRGLATYDGNTFWQLWDDASGTLALVRWNFDPTKRFLTDNKVIRSNTGLSLKDTLGAAMQQDGSLLVYVKEGNDSVSLYSLDINNSSSVPKLLSSNLQGLDNVTSFASFKHKPLVASDGDGAVAARGLAARRSPLSMQLAARGENLENWGLAQDNGSEQFGGGSRVIKTPSNQTAVETGTGGAGGTEGSIAETDGSIAETVGDNGGGGSLDLLYLLGLLLIYTTGRRLRDQKLECLDA